MKAAELGAVVRPILLASLASPLLAAVAQVAQPLSAPSSVTLEASEFPLGEMPRGMKCGTLKVSPDGQRIAYIVGETGFATGSVSVFVDDVAPPYREDRRVVSRGRSYKGVAVPVFSPDSQRVAYAALVREGAQTLVVGENEGTHYEGVDSPVFSPDGRRIAYQARRASREFIVLDGVEGESYEKVGWPIFSPDSQRIAHGAWRGKQAFVVVDGARTGDQFFEGIEGLAFSADGRHLAYIARRGKAVSVVLDGVEGVPYDEVGWLRFSPDGRVVYAARRKEIPFIVIEGAEARPHSEYRKVGDPLFSPDGRHLAYWASDGKKERVVLDEVAGAPYHEIGRLVFSPDSRHLAFEAASDRKWRLVVDGVEGTQYVQMDFRRGWVFERPDLLRFFSQGMKPFGRGLREAFSFSMTQPTLCGAIVRREVRIIEAAPPP